LNFEQTTWEKSEVLSGMFWGTTWKLWEPFQNLMGKHREFYEKKGKAKKSSPLLAKKRNTRPLISPY